MAEANFRHAVEFVMKTSPYTKKDIMELDVLTFFQILKECEKHQQEEVSRLEKQAHGRHKVDD